MTRANTLARNRRLLFEERIAAEVKPRRRLAQTWAWLFTEARDLDEVQVEKLRARVERAARRLNEERGRRRR